MGIVDYRLVYVVIVSDSRLFSSDAKDVSWLMHWLLD